MCVVRVVPSMLGGVEVRLGLGMQDSGPSGHLWAWLAEQLKQPLRIICTQPLSIAVMHDPCCQMLCRDYKFHLWPSWG